MAEIEGLGKASLELDADLAKFERDVKQAKHSSEGLGDALSGLAAAANLAEHELNKVKLGPGQSAESRASARGILDGVKGVSREALDAADNLDKVKLDARNAAETALAAEGIKRDMRGITGEANEARRALTSVRLLGGVPGRSGVGLGIIGSGYGRVGALGALIGVGALTAPAAGPATGGLLAAMPALAAGAAGALGTLVLALQGVGKAIGGDKKAFDELVPAQQKFVLEVRSLTGWLDKLKQTAAGNMFPGLTEGLHSALSPGTVRTISDAVAGMARAIGAAGAAWGRYFGSGEFQQLLGPLMQSGARNIGVLSDSLLHLFDAMSVLGRAAIPFTNWLNDAIDKGARFASSWMRAKDATGQLSRGLSEAQTSLRLVGGLAEALLRAILALGAALYPVSKIAVKDLTDGLNALAAIVNRNQQTIREIVSTALAGLVVAVKAAAAGVGTLWHAFEDLIGHKAAIVGLVAAIGVALAVSLGPTSVAIAAVITGVGLVRTHWEEISRWFVETSDKMVLAIVEPFSHLPAMLGEWARTVKLTLQGEMQDIQAFQQGLKTGTTAPANVRNAMTGLPGRGSVYSSGTGVDLQDEDPSLLSALQRLSETTGLQLRVTSGYRATGHPGDKAGAGPGGSNTQWYLWENSAKLGLVRGVTVAKPGSSKHNVGQAADVMAIVNGKGVPITQVLSAGQLRQAGLTGIGASDPVHVQLLSAGDISMAGAGGGAGLSGQLPAWTKNVPAAPKPPKPPVIPASVTDLLTRASANASKAKQLGNVGGTASRYLENELAELQQADKQLGSALKKAADSDKPKIRKAITDVENKIRDVQTLIKNSTLVLGEQLLPAALRDRLRQVTRQHQADVAYAQTLTGAAAEAYAAVISDDLTEEQRLLEREVEVLRSKLKTSKGRQRQAVQDQLGKTRQQLDDVQQQILQSLQANIQTLQQRVGTSYQAAAGVIGARFAAATQQLLDDASARYYQGGALTPSEQALAQMQAEDERKRVYATGDARQIAEYELQLKATAERTQADRDYAAEVKRIQEERARLEDEMNRKLAALGEQIQNGTGSVSDLATIAAAYGIQIDTSTIPEFAILSEAAGGLTDAFAALASYIAKITGTTPADMPSRPNVSGALAAAIQNYRSLGHNVPMLDTGGEVLETGLAVVHRGEVFSGIGPGRSSLGGVTFERGAIQGVIGNQHELAVKIVDLIERAARNGVKLDPQVVG